MDKNLLVDNLERMGYHPLLCFVHYFPNVFEVIVSLQTIDVLEVESGGLVGVVLNTIAIVFVGSIIGFVKSCLS